MADRCRFRLLMPAIALLLAGCDGDANPGVGKTQESPRVASAAEEEKVRALVARLKSAEDSTRAGAAEELSSLGPIAKPAVPALAEAAGAGDRWLQLAAIRALGRIGPGASEAAPQLREVASDPALGAEATRALEHITP